MRTLTKGDSGRVEAMVVPWVKLLEGKLVEFDIEVFRILLKASSRVRNPSIQRNLCYSMIRAINKRSVESFPDSEPGLFEDLWQAVCGDRSSRGMLDILMKESSDKFQEFLLKTCAAPLLFKLALDPSSSVERITFAFFLRDRRMAQNGYGVVSTSTLAALSAISPESSSDLKQFVSLSGRKTLLFTNFAPLAPSVTDRFMRAVPSSWWQIAWDRGSTRIVNQRTSVVARTLMYCTDPDVLAQACSFTLQNAVCLPVSVVHDYVSHVLTDDGLRNHAQVALVFVGQLVDRKLCSSDEKLRHLLRSLTILADDSDAQIIRESTSPEPETITSSEPPDTVLHDNSPSSTVKNNISSKNSFSPKISNTTECFQEKSAKMEETTELEDGPLHTSRQTIHSICDPPEAQSSRIINGDVPINGASQAT
eukprot:195488_1